MNSDSAFVTKTMGSPVMTTQRQGSKFSLLKGLALLLPFISSANTQEIGVEICSCAPGTYEFTLDFSLFCPPVNITVGDAVAATSCLVTPFSDPNVVDLVPVAVQSIDILELNQDLQISVQENIAGSFGDGDTFRYTSVAALPGQIINPADIPRAIQLNIIGVNRLDEPIINTYLITFTNNCGRYPVLFEGQFAGWTRFTDLQPPLQELCPLAPGVPSEPPSDAPLSEIPSVAPTLPPTSVTPPPTIISMPPTIFSLPPTIISMSMPMSMSMDFSMSMDIDMDLLSMMEEFEDIVEFGREPAMKVRDVARKKQVKKGGYDDETDKETKGAKGSKGGKKGGSDSGKGKGEKKGGGDDKETKGSEGSKGGKKGGSGDESELAKSRQKGGDDGDVSTKGSKGSKESKGDIGKGKGGKTGDSGKGSKGGNKGGSDDSKKTKAYGDKKGGILGKGSTSDSKKETKKAKDEQMKMSKNGGLRRR